MRALLSVLLLAALAVAVTLGARYNTGYVLVVLQSYRVELSLNFLIALLLAAFVVLYLLLRVVARAVRLPSDVRRWRERRKHQRARRDLLLALRAYLEGRFERAEREANKLLGERELSGFAAVLAARAAHELREFDRRDRYLARAAYFKDDDQAMRWMASADTLLESRDHAQALAALERLPRRHTAALRLELKAAQLAKNWERVLELVSRLERARVLDAVQARELRRHAVTEILRGKSHDAAELTEHWRRLAAEQRRDPDLIAAYARALHALGEGAKAQDAIEAGLREAWDSRLVALYGECAGADPVPRIERAEAWLKEHPSDPVLLLALGRLCAHQRLWGKAQSYFEASLALEESLAARLGLARLLEQSGNAQAAREHYAKSFDLALARANEQSVGALPGSLSLPAPQA